MYSLIHLSGRQLLPNVLANLAFSRMGALERSIILHSANEQESQAPARRLFSLLGLGATEDERIQCLQIEVEETLQSVTAEVLALFDEFPQARWVLHATGGNKMMSAALVLLARHPRVVAVVYRDIAHGWRHVTLGPEGTAPSEQAIAADHPHLGCLEAPDLGLDCLPLEKLIRAQFAVGAAIDRFVPRKLPRNADPAAWLSDTLCGWAPGFSRQPQWRGTAGDEGPAFECWLGMLLREAGATQVLWSCQGFSPQNQIVVETDLVAIHRNRIAVYDVKLERPGAPEKSNQIRAARSTADKLGGLSAAAVLVRPNWPPMGHLEQFAQALGVQLINRGNAGRLVPLMCAPLGLQDRTGASEALRYIDATILNP
jgi:hypothetical protein